MIFPNQAAAPPFDLSAIPALPQTLIDLLDACNDTDIDIYAIGGLVARDATISARILQLANSAFLGTRAAFAEIEQAVIYLGIDTVRNLAISVSVHEAFNADRPESGIHLPQFWYHSLLTAILAKNLAERSGSASPVEAYLCGLLHDLGKLLLAAASPGEYARVLCHSPAGEEPETTERRYLGISHAQAGALLVRHWGLQENVASAIERHHLAGTGDGEPPLAGIVRLANRLSADPASDYEASACQECGSISAEQLQQCRIEAIGAVEEIAQALGIVVERSAPPDKNRRVKDRESSKSELREKARQITILHGALDNLLKAHDRERICRVVEETLRMLFDVRHVFLLLPADSGEAMQPVFSADNPLQPRLADLPLPAGDAPSVIKQCRTASTVCHTGSPAENSRLNKADRLLADFLEDEALLAVPVPLSDTARGVLVAGLSHQKLRELGPSFDSLRLLAIHAGARLELEQFGRRMSAELMQREMAGVERLTRSIAHEIANPLAIVQNYLSALEGRMAGSGESTRDLRLIGEEIGRIAAIARQLENISDLSRRPAVDTARLDHLLRDTLTIFRESLFTPGQIEVQIRLQPETRPLSIPAAPLRQVLAILFTNAADALAGGGRIEISAALEHNGTILQHRILTLSVSDNGPGVPEEMNPAIFSAGVTGKPNGHLGLGLSIARKLLADLGGKIACTASTAGGACFTLRLPVD